MSKSVGQRSRSLTSIKVGNPMVYVRNRLEHWYLPLSAKPTAIGNKRRAKSGQLGVSIMCLGSET